MTRVSTPRAAAPARAVRTRAPKERRPSSLRTKRREQRKLAWIVLSVLCVVLVGIALYVLWLPTLRVATVNAEGPDEAGIAAVAREALTGTVFGLLPRNSIFLIPEADIRARVLDAYPAVQAVSISATGLNTLKVKALTRSSAFVWCGESIDLPSDSCYQADAEGLIYALYVPPVVATSTASSTEQTGSDLRVYGALEGASTSPIRAHVTYASALPGALKFIKAMRGLGADIGSVTLRGDEIDLQTKAGTRITYVIGKEGEAAILAATSFPTLNVNDGSIEYVDLRFANKVYLKRRE